MKNETHTTAVIIHFSQFTTMKLEALKYKLSVSYHNHSTSAFLKEHHWVITYALTSKKQKQKFGYQTNIRYIQWCLMACRTAREAFWHNDFLPIMSNLIAVSGVSHSEWSDQGIHVQNPA